jgi:glycine/D-amino acid oxidase-like deaminating enzyme
MRLVGFETYVAMGEEEKGSAGFENTGTLVVAPDEEFEEFVHGAIEQAREAGYQADYYEDHDKIREIVPDLSLEGILGAAYTPDDGFFDGTMISNTYARKARSNGAEILINMEVTEIHTTGGRVTGLTANGESYDLDVVVNAAGPWGRFVGRMVGIELPIWHTKGEVFILEPREPLGYPLPILKYPRFYARKDKDNVFVCRGHVTMDLSNETEAGVFDPDQLPMTGGTEEYFWDFLTQELMEHFPRLLESSVANDWVGYRAETKDFLPILGDTEVEGFLLAAGCGGNGVIEAPAIGMDMAKYIATGETPERVERFRLERFEES